MHVKNQAQISFRQLVLIKWKEGKMTFVVSLSPHFLNYSIGRDYSQKSIQRQTIGAGKMEGEVITR